MIILLPIISLVLDNNPTHDVTISFISNPEWTDLSTLRIYK